MELLLLNKNEITKLEATYKLKLSVVLKQNTLLLPQTIVEP